MGAGPPHARPRKWGDLGCLPPFLLESMLASGAAPQLRRICRRIGYWRILLDQGESIGDTSRVGVPIFGAWGLPQIAQQPNVPGWRCRMTARCRKPGVKICGPHSLVSGLHGDPPYPPHQSQFTGSSEVVFLTPRCFRCDTNATCSRNENYQLRGTTSTVVILDLQPLET